MRSFGSDNHSGVHPEILKAIETANNDHVIAYGDDPYTAEAVKLIQSHFGEGTDVYFMFNGTGSNVVSLKSMTYPFHSIICAETAHINCDECGAPENHTGCKLKPIKTTHGKLNVDDIANALSGRGDEHHSQPKVVSITQSTELGTVYTLDEIRALTDFCHSKNLLVHMDGARISNAAVSLNCTFKELTRDSGIDILSFGGTKNGMLMGESIMVFNDSLKPHLKYLRKQGMQLMSKMRFISAQFNAYLTDNLWKKNAEHANRMAQLLADKLTDFNYISLARPVEANGVFAILPGKMIPELQKKHFFYVWNESTCEVRLMTSFDTSENDINQFIESIRKMETVLY